MSLWSLKHQKPTKLPCVSVEASNWFSCSYFWSLCSSALLVNTNMIDRLLRREILIEHHGGSISVKIKTCMLHFMSKSISSAGFGGWGRGGGGVISERTINVMCDEWWMSGHVHYWHMFTGRVLSRCVTKKDRGHWDKIQTQRSLSLRWKREEEIEETYLQSNVNKTWNECFNLNPCSLQVWFGCRNSLRRHLATTSA